MNQLDLTPFFKTKPQAHDFSNHLSLLSKAMYQTTFNLESVLMEQFGLQKKDAFMTLLQDNGIAPESHNALRDFIQQLQDSIPKIPVLSLTLAFEPREQTLKVLSEWFLLNLKHQVIFDLTVDPQIIAGAAVSYNGRFFDGSIKPIFARILTESMTQNQTPPLPVASQSATTPQPTMQQGNSQSPTQ